MAITKENNLINDFIENTSFDSFRLKFIDSNLKIDLSETSHELVSVMQRAKVSTPKDAVIDIQKVIDKMPDIVKASKTERTREWIFNEFTSAIKSISTLSNSDVIERIGNGKVKFEEVVFALKPGDHVVYSDINNSPVGGVLKSIKVKHTFFGSKIVASISIISALKSGRANVITTSTIPYYDGVVDVSNLPIKKITEEVKAKLTERGRIFNEHTKAVDMSSYKGNIGIPGWFGENSMRADGRIIIDVNTLAQMEPDSYRYMTGGYGGVDDDDDDRSSSGLEDSFLGDENNISESHLWRCNARVPAFSLRLKMWGWFEVAGVSKVVWRDDAFNNLVLPNKDRVFHLVKHYGNSFGDFIEDKSGGLIFLLHGPTGQGKAQPLTSIIQTPDGPKTMGQMKVGDKVFAADGSVVNVLGVYPQGTRRVYEITFADGRKVKADENHLWKFKERGTRNKADLDTIAWDTVTTRKIYGRFKPLSAYMYIPLAQPYQLPNMDFPVDPWLLGLMLGDGFYKDKHCSFSSADQEIIDRVSKLLPEGYDLNNFSCVDYRIRLISRQGNETHWLKDHLKSINLYGKGSHERFIPELYFKGSVEQRFELLRGLMDSDGTAGKDKTLSFTSTSEDLALGVRKLVHGLGGIAELSQKQSYYRNKKGEKVFGKTAFKVSIRHPNPELCFWLSRKKERVAGKHQYKDTLALRIVDVVRVDDEPTQCILIDHPDHLYLTEDWIVTHNTLTAEAVAESLRRPLYAISMGELGTSPVEMEEKLRNILDLAIQWNAVLLLDEADIFMEARDSNDVERNAMVSIFLRILEYHSGVMFLTTNRVKSFDPAFFSRISMAIEYEPMNDENREQVWKNLLKIAGVDLNDFDVKKLAAHKINGRNMKTSLRLAQTNAFGHNRKMTQDDIDEVLEASQKFNQKIGIY